MNLHEKVTEYINSNPSEQIQILQTLRQLIHKAIPETIEEVKWGMPVFIKTKIFTYLRCTKNHVSLGIYNIEKINDHDGLLKGTGKKMKHLIFKKTNDINSELIINWLRKTAE